MTAIDRAAEAIFETVWGAPRDDDRTPDPEEIDDARTVLTATLTDPDDPDWLARVLWPYPHRFESALPEHQAFYRAKAAAVKAHLLKEDSDD